MHSWWASIKPGCWIPPWGAHYLLSVLIFTWALLSDTGLGLGLLSHGAQPACEGLHGLYTLLAASFLTPANLPGTCGCDSLQTAVKSELPAGSCNNCCQEHPRRGRRDGFCLFVSLFLWGGAGSESLFLIPSFPPLIFPPASQTSKQK